MSKPKLGASHHGFVPDGAHLHPKSDAVVRDGRVATYAVMTPLVVVNGSNGGTEAESMSAFLRVFRGLTDGRAEWPYWERAGYRCIPLYFTAPVAS